MHDADAAAIELSPLPAFADASAAAERQTAAAEVFSFEMFTDACRRLLRHASAATAPSAIFAL